MTFGGPIRCPKPDPIPGVREARRKAERAVRLAVRALVFARDARCALCGELFLGAEGDMHEIRPRSRTRGQAPNVRFNLDTCVRLHRRCHADASALRKAGLLLRRGEENG